MQLTELKKAEADYTFKDSVLKALGREGEPGPYLYVIASSVDKDKATKAASEINSILPKGEIKAAIVRPQGRQILYVVLNTPASAAETKKTNSAARAAAVEALQKSTNPETVRAATLLLEGEVVRARTLFE